MAEITNSTQVEELRQRVLLTLARCIMRLVAGRIGHRATEPGGGDLVAVGIVAEDGADDAAVDADDPMWARDRSRCRRRI